MKNRYYFYQFFLWVFLGFSAFGSKAQYIDTVWEYKPAPGQFINALPWGSPSSAYSLTGGIDGSLSLGAWGGYVVFSFDEPITNDPDHPFGVDFTLFGNPVSDWSEPGVVWVMKDENGNDLPDDTWYQLAGSDHFFSSTQADVEVTYFNPELENPNHVRWSDNEGNEGFIHVHADHPQPYYPLSDSFPDVDNQQYQLHGARLPDLTDTSDPPFIKFPPRAFGYADNNVKGTEPNTIPDNPYTPEVENAGGDGFDIAWAVDENMDYVDLDTVHFVKVQTAVLGNAGWVGEISTELRGGARVHPDPRITGPLQMIVIRDLPHTITQSQWQLEALAFYKGRVEYDRKIRWEVNMSGASVDENMMLTLTESGELTLHAFLEDDPEVSASVSVLVDLEDETHIKETGEYLVSVYPNPADDHIALSFPAGESTEVNIYHSDGRLILSMNDYAPDSMVFTGDLVPGIYLVRIRVNDDYLTTRFLKSGM